MQAPQASLLLEERSVHGNIDLIDFGSRIMTTREIWVFDGYLHG